jgi:hypothetical protein
MSSPSAHEHHGNISRCENGEGPEKTDTDAQKQAAVSHHFLFVRRIERPSLVALLRIALGERWSLTAMASSVCVFDSTINSRSLFMGHPGLGLRVITA